MSQSFNYRHLYYFWVVAKEGGIARAAERLDMAVQTISAQVRELEKALGVSLLRSEGPQPGADRCRRGGHARGRSDLCAGRAIAAPVREAAAGPTLRLNLGISDGIAKLAVHRLLTTVLDEPHLRLLCHEGEFQPLLGELAMHKLDAVLADRPAPPNPPSKPPASCSAPAPWPGMRPLVGRRGAAGLPQKPGRGACAAAHRPRRHAGAD